MDDHGLFRESLSRLLESEPDFRIVATCATAAEALEMLRRERVDIVLLDYDLGDENGLGLVERARAASARARILMVTAGMPDQVTVRAFEAGCSGIFLKHSPPGELVDAIHKVMEGDLWLDSGAIRSLVGGVRVKSEQQQSAESLTPRERAVLKAVFEGLSNKEIAAKLTLSESSVKAALQQLFEKTGVRTRSQLVRIALEQHAGDWLADEVT